MYIYIYMCIYIGIPQLPITPPIDMSELWKILQSRYLFPPQNRTHIYIFPGSIRHLHPEFDSALSILLRTDPMVMVVLAGMLKKILKNHNLS
jgi:hypothetical protein